MKYILSMLQLMIALGFGMALYSGVLTTAGNVISVVYIATCIFTVIYMVKNVPSEGYKERP